MSVSLPNGATVAIAAAYAASTSITAISNATSAVVTATNTFAAGDLVEITSGWTKLNNKIVRVKSATGTNFTLGVDTSDTTKYPANGGVGSVRKVSSFTPINQILASSSSGGEQQFAEYQFLDSDDQMRIPTVKSAAGISFTLADDATQPGYKICEEANDDRKPRAVTITLPSGDMLLYNAYVSLNKTPTLAINELMKVEVTLSLLAQPVRYAKVA